MYVCMYVFIYVCMYISMYVCIYDGKFIVLNVFCYVDIGHNQTVYIGVKNDPIGTQFINLIPAPSGDRK